MTSTTTPALQTTAAGAPFESTRLELRELGDHDVLIDIAWCGICHTDIHQARDEWGAAAFPLTPGHEIAGTVAAVGSAVTRHAVGDRVGVGCMVDSCGQCRWCKDGEEQFCERGATMTYNTELPDGSRTKGGYAQQVVVSEAFVVRVPDALPLDEAAPLLCAGITTYSPLKRWGAGPGRRVAVLGMGGLGHVAVRIAVAMGAEVTVLSRSDAKSADSLALGAARHVATGEEGALEALRGSFDLVLNTVGAEIPAGDYVQTLAPYGAFVTVGLGVGESPVEPGVLVRRSHVVAGSMIGGIAETQEMLDFCAEHGIGALVERVDAADPAAVDAAYDRVVAGDVRYRCVVDATSIA